MEEKGSGKQGGSWRSPDKKRDDGEEEEKRKQRRKIENKNNASKEEGAATHNRGQQHGKDGRVGIQNHSHHQQNSNENSHRQNNHNPKVPGGSNIDRRGSASRGEEMDGKRRKTVVHHDNNNNHNHNQHHHNNHLDRDKHNNHQRNNHNSNSNNQMARSHPPRQEHIHHHHHRQEAMVVSEDILEFWKRLGVRVHNSGASASASGRGGGGRAQPISLPIDANSHNDISMWMRTWGAAAMGAGTDHDQIVLIKAFLLVPDAINLTPPCDSVIDVLHRVVTYIHRECDPQQARTPLRGDRIKDFSSALETVVDIVRNRLMSKINLVIQPNGASLTVESLADPFHASVVALLMATNDKHDKHERMPRLLTRQIDIKSYAEALKKDANERAVRNVEASGSTEDAVTARRRDVRWNDWTRPTVGWLMSDSWHKTDELRSKYRDSEEYANTLARLWTVLTFYWGSGAVWQKCR